MESHPVVGIIAEYNPFHNGHAYQIARIRAQLPGARIVVLMSGSFTQRGEAAVLDKWQRASLAVRNGADLVCELPYVFACRSAQHFAAGGVRLLYALGCASHLAFGAETAELDLLSFISSAIDTPELQSQLHVRMKQGASYAAALARALTDRLHVSSDLLQQPNNILAIEYLRAIRQFAPDIHPLLIRRCGANHHEKAILRHTASASGIRAMLRAARQNASSWPDWKSLSAVMPPETLHALSDNFPSRYPDQELLSRPLLARLRVMTDAELHASVGIREGLENRLLRISRTTVSWQDLLRQLGTRRYPASSLSRLLIHLLTGFTKSDAALSDACGPAYLRVLAMNEAGAALLHAAKKRATCPILTKISRVLKDKERRKTLNDLSPLQQMLYFDLRATELRELALPQPDPASRDFLESPRILLCTGIR